MHAIGGNRLDARPKVPCISIPRRVDLTLGQGLAITTHCVGISIRTVPARRDLGAVAVRAS